MHGGDSGRGGGCPVGCVLVGDDVSAVGAGGLAGAQADSLCVLQGGEVEVGVTDQAENCPHASHNSRRWLLTAHWCLTTAP